jgi:hypothetical protein
MRGSRSRDIGGKAADEKRRPALTLTEKAAPKKSCRRRATIRFQCEGPQRARSGAFRSRPGAYRERPDASGDATVVHRSEA